jgi:hypothetical protein
MRFRSHQSSLVFAAAIVGFLIVVRPATAGPFDFAPGDLVISTVSSLNGGGLDTASVIALRASVKFGRYYRLTIGYVCVASNGQRLKLADLRRIWVRFGRGPSALR